MVWCEYEFISIGISVPGRRSHTGEIHSWPFPQLIQRQSLRLALLFTKGHFYDTSALLHSEHTPALASHAVIKTYTLKVIALRDISA